MECNVLIKCGLLFDGTQNELKPKIDILVESNRIVKVGKNIKPQTNTQVVDLSDATVTPGMIDAHIHLSVFDWPNRAHEMIYCSETWKAMAVLHNAQKALRRGFTSLRFMGCNCYDNYGSIDAKRVIDKGYFEGSRLVVAPYYVGSIGGMADASRAFAGNPNLARGLSDMYPGVGSGRDFFISSVREQAKMGADFIKLMASGGFSNPNGSPGDVQLHDDEYAAVIETAHQFHIPVTAHAYTPEIIETLVNLNIDGIEHGSLLDEKTAKLMEKKNVYLVPTFSQYDEIIHMDETALAKRQPAEFRNKLKAYGTELVKGRKVIIDSNLKLGYGTDMLDVHPCYECGYEYASWLESGIDPFRALKAATSVNAEIIGNPHIGTIEEGKIADIAAWRRDLLYDPKALLDCAFVMKDGVIYETEKTESH